MIFRSPYPDVSIPATPLTAFVLGRARELGEKPALIDGTTGRTITYGGLVEAVRRAAAGLAEHGLRKGEVMAIYCPNCPEYAVALFAAWQLGAVVTTVNPLYTADELAFQLKDAGAVYLLTIPQFMEKALQATAQSPVREIFVLGEAEGATPFAALMASTSEPPAVTIDTERDLAALPYSSGTTGLPKGVMLTHRNLLANLVQCEAANVLEADDRLIAVLPFFHIYGLVVVLNGCLYLGATLVTMPRFDLEAFLKMLQDYKITRAHLVPPIILALAKHPLIDRYDLSSLRTVFSGAAPLGDDVARACAERLHCRVQQGYGLTETSPVTHAFPAHVEPVMYGSVGVLLANTECLVSDLATGEPLGVGEQGEICIRGPQVMRGYLNRPQATAAMIDDDGWLHTGDVGYADAKGYFYIVDRVKELIKYKGMQVAPAELEAVLLTHPNVADVAVIPSPDEEAGEVPKAFVVRKGDLTEEEILAFVAARVAPHKKIRRLAFVEAIPKSASGKILRRVLVEQERAAVAT